jgi:nitronate monooxygenase
MDELAAARAIAPYPYQSYLLRPVVEAARRAGRTDVVPLWSGQAASLLRYQRAAELYEALVTGTDTLLARPVHTTTKEAA